MQLMIGCAATLSDGVVALGYTRTIEEKPGFSSEEGD
jgi:hypothetical protein